MFVIYRPRTPQWWLRLKLSIRAFRGTWIHTSGVHMNVGDTVNIHHKFYIVGKHYD